MKKYLGIVSILIMMFVAFLPCTIFAIEYDLTDGTAIASSDNFDFTAFDGTGNKKANKAAKHVIKTALTIIRIIATGVSIIMLTYIGMKYMTAAASERAELKKTAVIYVLGAVLVFGAQAILGIIDSFVNDTL